MSCPRTQKFFRSQVSLWVCFVVLTIATVTCQNYTEDQNRQKRVTESQESRYALCLRDNRIASGIRDYLNNTYPALNDPRLTPLQRDLLRQRLAYGNAVFADANCDEVVKGEPPPPLPPPPPPPVTPND